MFFLFFYFAGTLRNTGLLSEQGFVIKDSVILFKEGIFPKPPSLETLLLYN